MDGRKLFHCRHICRSLRQLLVMAIAPAAWAEAPDTNSTISYAKYLNQFSNDVAQIDSYSPSRSQRLFSSNHQDDMPKLDVNAKSNKFTQKKVGKFIYKAFKDPKKLSSDAAASAAYLGLDALGFAKPIKERVEFLKEKTRFNFGKCGKVEFSGKLKAESCLMDNSKIELNSNYKMDSVTVNFKWSL
ncbi:hypothetical protein [Endozoicomonas montiporae]|nr:hypothetical protein [Endozoicomonas montiporae]AMO55454.1 hypothetical protein EZMO1_1261 [Endozoicomonas montiporae CL-33]